MQKTIKKIFSSIAGIFLFITIVYLFGFFVRVIMLKKTVYGDGIFYYSAVRSMAVDHDVNFTYEYQHFGITQPVTSLGIPGNVYPIGPSLLWLPTFISVHNFIQGDGYSLPYQIAIGITGVAAVITGLLILYSVLIQFVTESIAKKAILLTAFATNLWYYGSFDTVNSHSFSFLIAVCIVALVLRKRSALVTGIFVGILSLIRTQDAIFMLLFAQSVQTILSGGLGFFLGFIPQLVYWFVLYGTIKSPYLDSNHTFTFLQPKLLEVLFSPNNGVLFWTSTVGIGFIGLFWTKLLKTDQKIRFVGLCILQWFLIASWSFWWEGASFSGRMFISVLPIIAFGFASVLKKLRQNQQNIFVFGGILITFGTMILYYVSH